MRIFILHNKVKAGSYADTLYHLLIQFLAERGFVVKEYHDANEVKNANDTSEKAAILLHTDKNKLPFFSKLKIQSIIKKGDFNSLIQITDLKPISSGLSQLIISNDIEIFLAGKHSSSTSYAICSDIEKQKCTAQNEMYADHVKLISITAGNEYQPITWSEQQAIKMQYTQGREYFLTFAGDKTIQSFTNLLKAFSTFKKWQHSSMKLVVIGKLSFTETEDWKEKINTYKFREDVVLLSSIAGNEVVQIIAGAYAFIHMPFIENDILALLQAMKCETPCLSFATDSIEEYTGEAAFIIEQKNYDQLAEKMILIYKDEALRSQLIEKGKEVSQLYSKEKVFTGFAEALLLPFH